MRTAFASAGPGQVEPLLRELVSEHGAGSPETQPRLLVALLDAARRNSPLAQELRTPALQSLLTTRVRQARDRVESQELPGEQRVAELALLGRWPGEGADERALLSRLLGQPTAAALHGGAVEALVRQATPAAAQALIA
ncbi:MAG: hypothetical protein ACKOJF_17745, partial [Planctomycetaceae bacterium]